MVGTDTRQIGVSGYEFTDAQNAVIRRLTGMMRLVGVTTSVLGVALVAVGLYLSSLLMARTGGFYSVNAFLGGAWTTGLPGLLFLSIGAATLRASGDFRAITRTSGNDVPLLLDALAALTTSYRAQLWFSLLGAVIAGVFAMSLIRG
jgi:hypothetical protein